MGWSYRKSFGSGPFRINFSKSGISYSVGVKGTRVNFGPKGIYVNLSSHGISYRKKISGNTMPSVPEVLQSLPQPYEAVHQIASADIHQLSDTDSQAFIAELTEKSGQIAYARWFGIFPLVAFLAIMAFTSFGSRERITQPETDSVFVRVTSYDGVNIRERTSAKSNIIKAAAYTQAFRLLDSTDQKWLKVGFNDSVGYINKRFANVEHEHFDQVKQTETFLANPYAGYEFATGLILFIPLIRWLKKKDRQRFEMELHYDMDEQFKQVYEQFGTHFNTFARSARIWQYLNARQTNDYKRTGGAGKLINRTPVKGVSLNKAPLPYFVTNVAIPSLQLNNLEFFFLPERLVVKRGNIFAAVFYKNLQIDGFTTRFIEDESVPHDAKIVGQTWRYVNKHGGPDRRFNNNRQIPICAYSEYKITSDTGVYEVITTSKQGAMDGFANFLLQIGNLQSKMAIA